MGSNLCRGDGSDTHPRPEWERGTGLRGSSLQHLPEMANSSLPSTTYPHIQRRADPDPGDLQYLSPLSQGSLGCVPSF